MNKFETLFAYVITEDDSFEVEIDSSDVVTLQNLKGNKDAIYAWLLEQDDELPSQNEILSVDVELSDNADVALSEGNETIDVWNV